MFKSKFKFVCLFTAFFLCLLTSVSTVHAGWLDNLFKGKVAVRNSASQIDKILMAAVKQNDIELAKTAISQGANVNCFVDNNMPLGIAASKKNYDMANLLLHNGADPEGWIDVKKNKKHYYIFESDMEMVPFFIDWGVPPNIRGNYNISLLHRVYSSVPSSKHIEVIKYLLEKGTDIDASPSQIVIVQGKYRNFSYKKGQTLLMKSAEIGDEEVLRLLLNYGANYKKRDSAGNTALDYAIKSKHTNTIKILMSLPK